MEAAHDFQQFFVKGRIARHQFQVIVPFGLVDGTAAHESAPQESPLAVGLAEIDGGKFRIRRK